MPQHPVVKLTAVNLAPEHGQPSQQPIVRTRYIAASCRLRHFWIMELDCILVDVHQPDLALVGAREDLPDRFPTALYRGVAMKPDGAGFYYSLQDRKTGIRVRYHATGSDPADDPVVFGEGYGPSEWIGAGLSESVFPSQTALSTRSSLTRCWSTSLTIGLAWPRWYA